MLGLGVMIVFIAAMTGMFGEKIEPRATVRAERKLTPQQSANLGEIYEVEKGVLRRGRGNVARGDSRRSRRAFWLRSTRSRSKRAIW
jgi:hypothetical protein